MALNRTYTGGRFMLQVGGYNVAFLKKFSGLSMEADIATHDLGTSGRQSKNVSNVKWTAAKATVGMGMGKGMMDWIDASFKRNAIPQDGTFTSADFAHKATSKADFFGALITGVTVPKLSGDSKDSGYFDVEFEPELVKWGKGDGSVIQGDYGVKQKGWLCSMFRVKIGDLPCDRIASVDSFTWKTSIAPDAIGITRFPTKHAAKVVVPDVKLAISMADHDKWADAARKWFIDGHHLDGDEMQGAITFLGPDMKTEYGEVGLKNVGFKKFSEDDKEANTEKIARFNVELYVEEMEFKMKETDK